jgi:hypothetical protein
MFPECTVLPALTPVGGIRPSWTRSTTQTDADITATLTRLSAQGAGQHVHHENTHSALNTTASMQLGALCAALLAVAAASAPVAAAQAHSARRVAAATAAAGSDGAKGAAKARAAGIPVDAALLASHPEFANVPVGPPSTDSSTSAISAAVIGNISMPGNQCSRRTDYRGTGSLHGASISSRAMHCSQRLRRVLSRALLIMLNAAVCWLQREWLEPAVASLRCHSRRLHPMPGMCGPMDGASATTAKNSGVSALQQPSQSECNAHMRKVGTIQRKQIGGVSPRTLHEAGCYLRAATGTSWYNMIQVEKFTEAQIDQMLQGDSCAELH